MATFAYYAQDGELKQIEGFIKAESYDKAIEALQAKGYYILSLQEEVPRDWTSFFGISLWRAGVTDEELVRFASDLAMLLDGGIPILRALRPLAKQATSPRLRKAVDEVIPAVASGKDLSTAMSTHEEFPRMLCQLVKAGETAGTLTRVLRQYAAYLNRQDELKKKVKSAMTYPVIVILFGLALTDFMAVKVIPTFAVIFHEFKLKLPEITTLLIMISDFIRPRQIELVIFAVALYFSVRTFLQTPTGLTFWSRFKRRIPVFNVMFEDMMMEQTFATLGMMLESGVSVLHCLALVKDIYKTDPIWEQAMDTVLRKVNAGEGLAASFRWTRLFDELATDAMAVGEEAGNLPRSLESLAKFHGDRLDVFCRQLPSLLEPFMLIFVGVIVCGIMLSLFLPMTDMMNIRMM